MTSGAAVPAAAALAAAVRRIDRLDAEVLLAHLLGIERGAVLLSRDLRVDPQAYDLLVERRAGGEPVAYIIGRREFWSLDLSVTSDVLIPRPDSETLIEAAVAAFAGRAGPRTVLDLGTGSGALLLAALSEFPESLGIGVDISEAALVVARANAARTGIGGRAVFARGDWTPPVVEGFGLVLCNPPYVETGARLAVDVRFEPDLALFAGIDGLDAYRRLLPGLPGLLTPKGVAVVEIGSRQAGAVLALAAAVELVGEVRRDLAGRDRCLVLRRG